MKSKYIVLFVILVLAFRADAQLDRSKAPLSDKAPSFKMVDPVRFELKNGLRVIVMSNSTRPSVNFNLYVDKGAILEGDKAGLGGAFAQMLTAGTTHRTKAQLNEEIDFIGANIDGNENGITASSLAKHSEQVLELMSDMLQNPTFPDDELALYKKQTLSSIEAGKATASSIAGNVRTALLYGKAHPYGELMTETSLKSITMPDVKAYYNSYIRPQMAYLVIVGNMSVKDAKRLANKHFKAWKPNAERKSVVPVSRGPQELQVAVSHKPGSVQTYLNIVKPILLSYNSPDYFAVRLLQSVLGGGSDGRLFKNIREDKGYTYGAYCRFSPDQYVGNFVANAEVRNGVTDSAVVQFLYEFDRLRTEKVGEDEIKLHKSKFMGEFARSLENDATFATFALNTQRYALPADFYATFLQNINAVTADDLQKAAQKYLGSEGMTIIAVGDRELLNTKLAKFSTKPVVEYDYYADVVDPRMKPAPKGVTAQNVVDGYLKAIRFDKIAQAPFVTIYAKMVVPGMPVQLSLTIQTKKSAKYKLEVNAFASTIQEERFDGTKAVRVMQGNAMLVEAKDMDEFRMKAAVYEESVYAKLGYTTVLKGVETVGSQECYVLEFTKGSTKALGYYATDTFLKLKGERTMDGPQGAMSVVSGFADYVEFSGVMMASKVSQQIGSQSFNVEFTGLDLLKPIDDAVFTVN